MPICFDNVPPPSAAKANRMSFLLRSLAICSALCVFPLTANAEDKTTSAAADEGFVSLFDGKSLDGWQGSTKGYVVEDGVIVCKPDGGGNLYTEKEYSDFVFRFDFKL